MTLDDVNRRRSLAGKAAALFCVLFFLCVLDGVISHFGQSANDLKLLPGTSVKVNGPAKESIRDIQELEYVTSSDLITIAFERVHTGYWMGGRMWRGVLTIGPDLVPGEYSTAVRAKDEPSEKPFTVFRIRVFADSASLQESAASIVLRQTGISPWWGVAIFFPVMLLLFGTVYLLSNKREQLMRQEGRADIYRITKKDDGYEVSFSLGTRHGVNKGSRLALLDGSGVPVGTVEVIDAYEGDSVAFSIMGCTVKPGYMVSLEG
jgi:hypothetical protein